MQRQVWKENSWRDNIKVKKEEKEEEERKGFDPLAYPFGAEEVLLRAEFAKIEKSEER